MQLQTHVVQVQSQLTQAAALGDDSTRATANALATIAEPAVRLAILAAVSAAADEITAALLDYPGAPVISISVDGDDLRVDVRASASAEPVPEPAAPDDADNVARISLRLSEALKAQIETAARSHTVSVNTWLLRAAAAVLAGAASQNQAHFGAPPGTTHHLTGWING